MDIPVESVVDIPVESVVDISHSATLRDGSEQSVNTGKRGLSAATTLQPLLEELWLLFSS